MNRDGNLAELAVRRSAHKKNVEAFTQFILIPLWPEKERLAFPFRHEHASGFWLKSFNAPFYAGPDNAQITVPHNPKRIQYLARPQVFGRLL